MKRLLSIPALAIITILLIGLLFFATQANARPKLHTYKVNVLETNPSYTIIQIDGLPKLPRVESLILDCHSVSCFPYPFSKDDPTPQPNIESKLFNYKVTVLESNVSETILLIHEIPEIPYFDWVYIGCEVVGCFPTPFRPSPENPVPFPGFTPPATETPSEPPNP